MQRIDLGGRWQVRRADEEREMEAAVPGCIHTDLLAADRIADPFYRDNESRQFWIGESDWLYSRSFSLPSALLAHRRVLLVCESLDTLADIRINGHEAGSADNQFRRWEFDVGPLLRPGENRIEILFRSPFSVIDAAQNRRYLTHTGIGEHRIAGGNRIRKSQCNFGWDWGPESVTCGIPRPIYLLGFSTARLRSVLPLQEHRSEGDRVTLRLRPEVERIDPAPLRLTAELSFEGNPVASGELELRKETGELALSVADPQLWWPRGMGGQPLYRLSLELRDAEGTLLDSWSGSIGLRRVELLRRPDQWGESFAFAVNGVPLFAKGANWIPADHFPPRISPDHYEHLIASAAEAHMNMLRVWGGGIYEPQHFYDLCDRYGLLVWHDFMFTCSAYPADEEDFLTSVRAETIDTLRALRHHPSIALWCGNNEIEQIEGLVNDDTSAGAMSWGEYRRLFDELLPELVSEYAPQSPYWPSSPHSPCAREDANDPRCGDAHLWEVWHGRRPFEWYRSCGHRFNSEFGFQSFPEARTAASFTAPEDRNISSYVMEYHQRSGIGNTAIMQYLLQWFRLPRDFPSLLRVSQILQGTAMQYAVEHWRRSRPRGMGTLYWQLNDTWPGPSWSSIDYFGRWKALHYLARHFYAPLLLTAVEDPEAGMAYLYLCSDLGQESSGLIRWSATDTDGCRMDGGTIPASAAPLASRRAGRLDLSEPLRRCGSRRLLLWLRYEDEEGKVRSRTLLTFARPKHLELSRPQFSRTLRRDSSGRPILELEADRPALWVWAEDRKGGLAGGDAFFHLAPGEKRQLSLTGTAPPLSLQLPCDPEIFLRQLELHSLRDTYEP